VSTVGHLSDLHLSPKKPQRTTKLLGLLLECHRLGLDHLVITGDLTCDGRPEEVRELDRALLLTGWLGRATVVPGNHDGHLGGFAMRAVDLGDAVVLPVDTRIYPQPAALGAVGGFQGSALERATRPRRTTILAMHHGPQGHPLQAIDGLMDRRSLCALLSERPHVHVLCGHDHRVFDWGPVHAAGSVAHHPDPLRVYGVGRDGVRVVKSSAHRGNYLPWGG